MWVANDNLAAWRARKRGQIAEDFSQFASRGIFAVRWFLLADGTNYGMGEFATAAETDWPDLKSLYRDQTVANRLCCIEEKGYPACFLWSARAADAATRWTAEEHRSIMAYADSRQPESKA